MSSLRNAASNAGRASTGSSPVNSPRGRRNQLQTASSLRSHRSPRHSPPPHQRSASATGMNASASANRKHTATSAGCNVEQLVERLSKYRKDMKRDHGLLAKHTIETTQATERRPRTGQDLFANLPSQPTDDADDENNNWRIKFKDHSGQARETQYTTKSIKTLKDAVPRYFNHHVEVEKNVVAPQTSMAFYPHKGDLDSPRKQKKWKGYIKQLDQSEVRSGLDAIKIDQKRAFVIHHERVLEAATYLDTWLEDLEIPSLDKWALVKVGFGSSIADYLPPENRHRVAELLTMIPPSEQENSEADTIAAVQTFLDAWKIVFKMEKATHGVRLPEITLGEVLGAITHDYMLENEHMFSDESGLESKKEDDFEALESRISTYSSLSCLICFRHSCEHGYYDDFNERERFTLEKGSIARRLGERQRRAIPKEDVSMVNGDMSDGAPCQRRCYILKYSPGLSARNPDWTPNDRKVLRSIYLSSVLSTARIDPICHVADLLDRDCCDVQVEFQHLHVTLPPTKILSFTEDDLPRLNWYNRYNKKLSKRHGADKYHKPNWDHIRRDIDNVCALRGCDHEGLCTPDNKNCPCARKGQFCEKFCGCTVDECSYKFTGCACHSQGKTCQVDQKGEECICIQLNRECDPDLCGSCGALERADPKNADNEKLHATGCQNCALQRGVEKPVVVGKGRFHGYGLFAAENIRKDTFVIEYVGELVSGDEGDRRYIRRQNLFDGTKALSFNFTLLKECDVWVDGAKYGNLSRYINHEKDKCNLVPRIVLVNGGFRIEFRAKRNIKAWEELSFDYGEDFGLDIEKKARNKKLGHTRGAARKNARRGSPSLDSIDGESSSGRDADSDEEGSAVPDEEEVVRPLKRKRSMRFESEEEDYQPTGKSRRSTNSGRDSDKPRRGGRPRGGARGGRGSRGGRGRGRGATRGRGDHQARTTRMYEIRSPSPAPSESSGEVIPASRGRRGKRRRTSNVVEIDDSEDEDLSLRVAKKGAEANTEPSSYFGDDGNDDEDDDDDSRSTPQKRDQPSRNRRQPAKFKDDELYAFKPSKRGRGGRGRANAHI